MLLAVLQHVELSDGAFRNQFFRPDVFRRKAYRFCIHQLRFVSRACADHRFRGLECVGQRFFSDHMLASLRGSHNNLPVQIVGNAHDNYVKILAFQQPPIIGHGEWDFPLACKFFYASLGR